MCSSDLLCEQDGKLFVADLGSSNGTFVNGRRIQGEVELGHGDELEVGPVRMVAVYAAAIDGDAASDAPAVVVAETTDDPLADARDTHPANNLFETIDGDETSLVRDSNLSPDSEEFWNLTPEDSSTRKPGESPF